jgi:hypothetical protein
MGTLNEMDRPWSALPIRVPDSQGPILDSHASRGGRWSEYPILQGPLATWQRIADIASRLYATIPTRRINKCTVHEALTARKWISDIKGALTVGVMAEFLQLWDIFLNIQLQPGVNDTHFWRLATNRQYSAKVAYEGFFVGSVQFEPFERIWKTWAPPKCHFFLWLVEQRKCWTVDRLARRGLDHPEKCPLCDQESETIDHLLISCVFARQFWFTLLRQFNLQELSPQPDACSFLDWWRRINGRLNGIARKNLYSVRQLPKNHPLLRSPVSVSCSRSQHIMQVGFWCCELMQLY